MIRRRVALTLDLVRENEERVEAPARSSTCRQRSRSMKAAGALQPVGEPAAFILHQGKVHTGLIN
jgi:hypothetical protein